MSRSPLGQLVVAARAWLDTARGFLAGEDTYLLLSSATLRCDPDPPRWTEQPDREAMLARTADLIHALNAAPYGPQARIVLPICDFQRQLNARWGDVRGIAPEDYAQIDLSDRPFAGTVQLTTELVTEVERAVTRVLAMDPTAGDAPQPVAESAESPAEVPPATPAADARSPRGLTPERQAKAIGLILRDLSVREIAEAVGVDKSTLYRDDSPYGFRRAWDAAKVERAREQRERAARTSQGRDRKGKRIRESHDPECDN